MKEMTGLLAQYGFATSKLYTIYSSPEHPDGTVHKPRPKSMSESIIARTARSSS